MQGHGGSDGEDAQGVDAEDPTNVEIFEQEDSLKAAALHGIHEDQRCVNKKEQHSEEAERGCGRPGDMLDMHPPAKVLCEDEENSNGSQKVEIGRRTST